MVGGLGIAYEQPCNVLKQSAAQIHSPVFMQNNPLDIILLFLNYCDAEPPLWLKEVNLHRYEDVSHFACSSLKQQQVADMNASSGLVRGVCRFKEVFNYTLAGSEVEIENPKLIFVFIQEFIIHLKGQHVNNLCSVQDDTEEWTVTTFV